MKLSEAYDKYIIRANKNGVNDNVATDNGRFVELLYNSYLRYIGYILNNSDKDRREIQELLVSNYKIESDNSYFNLPDNFFDFSSLNATAEKGSCKAELEVLYEIKDENRNLIMSDAFTSPSFEYREAPFILTNNAVKILTGGEFKVKKIRLNYYRYPKKPRLIHPNDPESGFDDTFDLELQDRVIDKIIDVAVGIFDINNDNPRAKLNIERAISKI